MHRFLHGSVAQKSPFNYFLHLYFSGCVHFVLFGLYLLLTHAHIPHKLPTHTSAHCQTGFSHRSTLEPRAPFLTWSPGHLLGDLQRLLDGTGLLPRLELCPSTQKEATREYVLLGDPDRPAVTLQCPMEVSIRGEMYQILDIYDLNSLLLCQTFLRLSSSDICKPVSLFWSFIRSSAPSGPWTSLDSTTQPEATSFQPCRIL